MLLGSIAAVQAALDEVAHPKRLEEMTGELMQALGRLVR
jgi:hypothetical protein